MRRIAIFLPTIALAVTLAFAAGNVITLTSGGEPAALLQLPEGWKAKTHGEKVNLSVPKHGPHLQIWAVPTAKTLDAAVLKAPEIVKDEISGFKADSSSDIVVAGAPAKHLIGTATEVDDGDPSNVEVVVFSVGEHVFLECAHDDANGAAKRRDEILKVLDTAKAP